MMKLYQAHKLARATRSTTRKSRNITAVLLAGAIALTTSLTHAKPSDVSPKYAPYDNIAGAEKISLKLLSIQKDVKSGELKDAAHAPGLKGYAKSKDGSILVEVICYPLNDNVLRKFALPGITVRDSYPQYNRLYLLVSDLGDLSAIAQLEEVSLIRPVSNPQSLAYRFSGAADSRGPVALKSASAIDANITGAGQTVGLLSDSFSASDGVRDGDTVPPFGFAGNLMHAKNQDNTTTNTQAGPLSLGDLPSVVQIVRDNQFGNHPLVQDLLESDEGAAMGELVHDIAPGAGLAFHTAVGGQGIFADGIRRLVAEAGSTILVDDVIYLDEPMYQDGIIAQEAAKAVKAGIPFFSAAGNNGDAGLIADYKDINPSDDQDFSTANVYLNDFHDWGGGNAFLPIQMPAGSSTRLVVQWNQPFVSVHPKPKAGKAGARVDLDVYVYSSPPTVDQFGNVTPGNIIAFSNEAQGIPKIAQGDAVESDIELVTGTTQTVYLAIHNVHGIESLPQKKGQPIQFRAVFFDQEPVIQSPQPLIGPHVGPTIYGHSVAAGVVSVGAVPWWEAPAYRPNVFGPTSAIDPEFFSARGGNLFIGFDAKGKRKGRGFFAPTLAAVDGNNTTFFGQEDIIWNTNNPPESTLLPEGSVFFGEPDGFPNFFGTSAAAPNAAGVAALIKQKNAGIKPAQITQLLESTAVDVTGFRASFGTDDVSGAGLIDAHFALGTIDVPQDGGPFINLTFAGPPAGWDDSIVINQTIGSRTTAESMGSGLPTYINVAVVNDGLDASGAFNVVIREGATVLATRNVPGLAAGQVVQLVDIPIGAFGPGSHTIEVTIDDGNLVNEGTFEFDNVQSRSFEIEVANLTFNPDILILTHDPNGNTDSATLATGQNVYAVYTIQNDGTSDIDVSFVTKVQVDGVDRATSTIVGGLNAGESVEVRLNLGPIASGNHNVTAFIDSTNVVAESDETAADNQLSRDVNVTAPIPNLTFNPNTFIASNQTSATVDQSPIFSDQTIYVTFTVINNGTAPSGATTVRARVDAEIVDRATTTVPALAPGATHVVRDLPIGTVPEGPHTVHITVDPLNVVVESNEGDNTISRGLNFLHIDGDVFADAINLNTGTDPRCVDDCLSHTLSSNIGATTGTEDRFTSAGATIWFKYTAPSHLAPGDLVTFDTAGSSFDTILTAYTNFMSPPDTAANILLIASNDNIQGGSPQFVQSQITLPVTPNRTYYISVGGVNGQQGSIRLNWACDGVRLRDHFAHRITTSTLTFEAFYDSSKSATPEPSEPNPVLMDYQKTNWFSITVTTESLTIPGVDNRPVRISVLEFQDLGYPIDSFVGDGITSTIVQGEKPRYNPLIGVYTGGSIDALTLYTLGADPAPFSNDPYTLTATGSPEDGYTKTGGNARLAEVTFVGFVGVTYQIQIDGLPTCLPNDPSSGSYQIKIEQLQPQ